MYPFMSGTPLMPRAPRAKAILSLFFFLPHPRISSRFSLCRFMTTTPAHMKRVSLMMEWFTIWSRRPGRAMAYPSSLPAAESRISIPTPVRMKPICDMDEHASVRLRLTEKTPRTAPSSMVIMPAIRMIEPNT